MADIVINGTVAPQYEPLVPVFARVLGEAPEAGAALCVYHDGVAVADLYGGPTYGPDTRQLLFSVSKALTAIAVQRACQDGLVDLDAPIYDVWPEFDRPDTRAITTRVVLGHRAGLPAVRRKLRLEDIVNGRLEHELARQEPFWEPDTDHGYHALTIGTLLDGILRRACGRSVADIADESIAGPLDLRLGFGVGGPHAADVAPLQLNDPVRWTGPSLDAAADELNAAAVIASGDINHALSYGVLSDTPIPAANAVGRARDLAKMLAATMGRIDGTRVIDEKRLMDMCTTLSYGHDRVLGETTHFGAGVHLPSPRLGYFGPGSFGHDGYGGSIAGADTTTTTSFAFITDLVPRVGGATCGAMALTATLRQCLDDLQAHA